MYYTNITQYFDSIVAKCPDRIAVYDGDRTISFYELHKCAVEIAFQLHNKLKCEMGKVIAVYLNKSMETIIADLAILYSGNIYMNLGIKSPEQRIQNIIRQTSPAIFITDNNIKAEFSEIENSIYILNLEEIEEISEKDRQFIIGLRDVCIDTDLLCIINTSGSTGTPKAVALSHRSFIDFTEVVGETGLIGENEIFASMAPPFFDHFSFELCMLMARACALVIVPESYAAFPVRLLELMAARHVSYLFWVPTIMVNIANMDLLSKIPLPDLKMVWFAGEVFPTAKFNYWRKMLPQARFVNLYGPTEITVDCVYHEITRPLLDNEPIPIGRPFRNTSVLVLNEDGRPVSPGEDGELYIRGSSLALGYYNNPEKTSLAFIQNPLNTSYHDIVYRTGDIVSWNEYGELVFKGRKDTLIKHSGYRIELTEIEHIVVNILKIVNNACALYDLEQKRIILIYESDMPLSEKELRQSIGNEVPRYMVPTVYKHITEMPRNANGKIDRLALQHVFIKNR